nr:unnamed protein product [Spirometra erinaceieuropaei]
MYIPVPPKELHLAVNDTLLTNAADNCGHEEEAVDENTNEEEGCGQVTNWIEIDDPVRITCSSEPSLPAAQLEWLVNGEVPQFDTYRAVDLPVDQSPLRSVGDSCQCGHVCGGREQATDMTRQLNNGVIARLRTYTVKICGMANNAEKFWSLIYNVESQLSNGHHLPASTLERKKRHVSPMDTKPGDSTSGHSDISILPTRQMHRAVLRCTVISSIVRQKGEGTTKPLSRFADLLLNVTYGPTLKPPDGDIVLLSALNGSVAALRAYRLQKTERTLRATSAEKGQPTPSEMHVSAFHPVDMSEVNMTVSSNETSIQLECGVDAHPEAQIDWILTRPDGLSCPIGSGPQIILPQKVLSPGGYLSAAHLCLNFTLKDGFCPSDRLDFTTKPEAGSGHPFGLPNLLLQILCLARSDGFPHAKRSILLAVPIKPHINLTVLKSFGESSVSYLHCEVSGLPIPNLGSLELRLHAAGGKTTMVLFGAGDGSVRTSDTPISLRRTEFGWSLKVPLLPPGPAVGGFYNCSVANGIGTSWKVIDQPRGALFEYFRVQDPVLPSHIQFSAEATEMEVVEPPDIVGVDGPGLSTVKKCHQDDGVAHLQFDVHLKTPATPHNVLHQPKSWLALET